MSDVNVIIFMRFLGNCVLDVQRKTVSESFGHILRKTFVKYALKGMTANVILRQVA